MKMNGIDFDTYFKNYPDKDGFFGRYGGCYISDDLKKAMEEITNWESPLAMQLQWLVRWHWIVEIRTEIRSLTLYSCWLRSWNGQVLHIMNEDIWN